MANYISSIPQDALNSLCEEIDKYNKINPAYFDRFQVKRGLRNSDGTGVMAGLTKICSVQGYYVEDGERVPIDGRLIYRGIDVREIVSGCEQEGRFGFEEVAWLLLFGTLPSRRRLEIFKSVLAESRELPNEFIEDMIMKAPSHNIMNKLSRSVLALYSYDENPDDISIENVLRQSIQLLAQIPMIMSYAYQVKRRNFYHESMYLHPVDKTLSTAESVLYSIRADKKFTPEEAHMLDICLMLHAEHGGGNNSTFATRVLTSSGTDTYSAIAAGIGSLKGPKHGGANIKVAEMVEYIKQGVEDITDADQVADFRLHSGYNLLGSGSNLDVCIPWDRELTPEGDAILCYDEELGLFSFGPRGRGLPVRVNGKMTMDAVVLSAGDRLTVGDTALLFVPLCGKDFRWEVSEKRED